MNLNVLEKYVNLCDAFSIKPSWKGLNEYYKHNIRKSKITRRTSYLYALGYRSYRN